VLYATVATASLAHAETVTFAGDGAMLSADVFVPSGTGPFPAVVALHGCGGAHLKSGELAVREADWGARLAAAGFLVVVPDSFASRGLGNQCRNADRTVRASRERIGDALAAKAYLASRADVKRNAISLLGWSNGATTVLYAIAAARAQSGDSPDFARAIAFYPGCRRFTETSAWRTRIPLLILMGEADDWTPFAPCKMLADRAKSAGSSVELIGYPGAYHDFDDPAKPVRVLRGLATTASGTGAAHQGTNPAGRADALVRVPAFLAR